MTLVGLPHSEIPGSKRACRSPRHIAACHVLLRLSVPRHPPSTLSNLTIKCLDLMRSAARHYLLMSVHLFSTTRIQLSMNEKSRRPTLNAIADCAQGSSTDFAAAAMGGVGGADRDRTDDPLLAKQMLSQLSYSPGRRLAPD